MVAGVASLNFGLDYLFKANNFIASSALAGHKYSFSNFAVMFRTLAFHSLFLSKIWLVVLAFLGHLFLAAFIFLVKNV